MICCAWHDEGDDGVLTSTHFPEILPVVKKQAVVKIKVGTLCIPGQVYLLWYRSVLVCTHVYCSLRDGRRAALFLSCSRRLGPKLGPRWENPSFPI